ncbi:lysosomal acid glucosylceramidase [Lutzomyia longipalpis]|uniref:lysosomal acid glucosylceramidase n=1 Tax=Lutzomyia longipalpis TaxID=7200 RepID=UPI002483898A|nr:lysosomal acid glucosylceramidase [Lutzomyia longipalpis]
MIKFHKKLSFLWWILFIITIKALPLNAKSIPCNLREYPNGYVCVCSKTNCDFLDENVDNPGESDIVIVTSSQAGLRFNVSKFSWPTSSTENFIIGDLVEKVPQVSLVGGFIGNLFGDLLDFLNQNQVNVNVDPTVKYQKVVGFGGAFTGAVSHNLDQLSPELQDLLYKSYYSRAGIGYNFMRIPIGGCDFDLQPWAYNENPQDDARLSNFSSLDPRDVELINKIKHLQDVSGNRNIKFLGSAWSSPIWMKTNNDWTGASSLKEEYYQTWADYHVRFIDLMAKSGVNLWGITTGNEPMNGVIGWLFVHFMSLGWTARPQAVWVADHLAPALRNSSYGNVKIFAGDDQRYTFPWWFNEMVDARPNVMNDLAGFAVHWYWDRFVPPLVLDTTHKTFTNKLILNTESSIGDKPLQTHGPILGSWARAEEYITAYLQDLQHSVNGWIDWNLLLDEQGGPNYVNNFVDSAVIVNKTADEAYKQPLFYAIGHFSRFITEDSVRIKVSSSDSHVEVVGFQRPDGRIVLVIYNKKEHAVKVVLNIPLRTAVNVAVPGKSIHSVIFFEKKSILNVLP